MQNHWHTKTINEIFDTFHSDERGLDKSEVTRRFQEYGPNKLPEGKIDSLPVIFFRQFQSPLIYILLAASAIVFAMGETIDSSIILAVLLFNAVVGTIQEGKAQNTLLALKKFVETNATVLRGGKELIVPDSEVVPGDILILVEGDKIPADARIIISHNLKIDEASLTGESEPVHKIADILDKLDLPIAEQKNMVFKGTHIVAGSGKAIVVATGLSTAVGKIAKEIAAIDTEIPLKANIRYLSRLIIIAVASISVSLFSIGIFLGKSFKEMFTTVVSLSVSIIPEGLPIVVTLVLATGVWRMSKRNALVKKLQAVEALGQARMIAVDKTGTITKNELVIQQVYVDGKLFAVGGIGYEPRGDIRFGENIIDPLNHPELLFAGKISAFCANAHAAYDPENKKWRVFGDPTEAALAVFAEKIGFRKDDLERESPKIAEVLFDYKTKYHATVHGVDGGALLTVVGAPEIVLRLSSKKWDGGSFRELSKKDKENLESVFLGMSQEGLRVLALAIKENAPQAIGQEDIYNLTFVGFVGMKDALRPEVKDAMQKATSAGIRVVMITGDHKLTAQSIAKEAGIFHEGDKTITGQDIDVISDEELSRKLEKVSVFARVTPEHKLRIINAYRRRGEVIAMTGDGVNDAPSLVAADLGVAMGKIGTEVAKEASDIVLLDDNFGSIISAVEEGRSIYKTTKKVILYLFSTSMGEVLTIAGALFLGWPLPILAAQIIWLNFVTDGFLDLALAMEPKEKGLLRGYFERPKKYLVDKLMAQRMFVMAIPMMISTLLLFKEYFEVDMVKAWTISLTTLAVFQWFNAWNCRHESKSIFQMNPFSNKFLVGATITTIFLQILAIYNPMMQKLLRTTELSFSEWIVIIPVAASIVLVEELRKFFYRRSSSYRLAEKSR
ncbi:MAG TPA: HAD-IC family P-type ATPase [Candidatus Paceibacterota bacterium]|nr:HAD-IC family P-type ATPase [Candidatus Paceibacterota bacterium]